MAVKESVWTPFPRQSAVLERSEREVLTGGSRGGGKTELAQAWLGEPEYFYHSKYRALIIRKNRKDLDDFLFRLKHFFNNAIEITGNPPKIKFPKGGEGVCGHMDDANAWEDYVGHEYQKILWEELTLIPQEEMYLKVLMSCRSTIDGLKAQSMASTNPGGPGHQWVKKRFVDVALNKTYFDPKNGLSRIFIPMRVQDNPAIMEKDPDYVKMLQSLPEPLRSAWYEGSWDVFSGQFFHNLDEHNREDSFELPYDCQYALFGSLDHGISHDTAFGIGYADKDHDIHLVASYLNNGGTTEGHAGAIWDMIASNRNTHGIFPHVIYYDPSMDTKKKMSDQVYISDIDIYMKYFKEREPSKYVVFIPANNRKVDGCHIMRDVFEPRNNKSVFKFFSKYNEKTIEQVKTVLTDENNTEIYAKQDGDDAADMLRYLIVGMYTYRSSKLTKKIPNTLKTPKPESPYRKIFVRQTVGIS
jgi:hypothetical protein